VSDSGFNLDREAALQELLANAFAAQETHIDTQSLAASVEMQRLIRSGSLDMDGAMHLIADCAQGVSNATGVAIGLLKGDQLIYHAGSGSAAAYPGRQVRITLVVPAGTSTSREILRVEDAQTNKGIEAAICRQLGANAILILLIYEDRAPAGVLEVHFSEAHVFQDREVCTYRLMASLVGEAIGRTAQQARKNNPELSTVPPTIAQIVFQMKKAPSEGRSISEPPKQHAIDPASGPAKTVASELPASWHSARAATRIRPRAKLFPLLKLRSRVAVPALVAALVITFWIAYSNRYQGSPLGASAQNKSGALEQQVPLAPAMPASANGTSKPQTPPVPTEEAKVAKEKFQRVRVGKNEVDYIAEDVTIRYFMPLPPKQRMQGGDYQVHFGKDVTLRYFATKPAVLPSTRVVPGAAEPPERAVPVPRPERAGSPARSR
jgi:hypothetical protein